MRYKCTVSYIGKNYCGWQSQRNGDSIQEQIEHALYRLTGEKVNILASGRTDKGVNAAGQVFHFDTDKVMRPRKWQGAINAFLPDDIHICSVEEAEPHFHARYCVRKKTYAYRIHFGEADVFSREYAYQCPYTVDIGKMKAAAEYLVGKHDFAALCSNSFQETPDQVRTVYGISFAEEGDMLTIRFTGDGFLRYQVRMMSALLLEIGQGRRKAEDIPVILASRSKRLARKNAHPEGLTLEKVEYFRILAESESTVVKELTEEYPEIYERFKNDPEHYVIADRHLPIVFAMVTVNHEQSEIHLFSSEYKEKTDTVFQELSEALQRRKIRLRYGSNIVKMD